MPNNDVDPTLEIFRMSHVMTFESGFYIITWRILGHITHPSPVALLTPGGKTIYTPVFQKSVSGVWQCQIVNPLQSTESWLRLAVARYTNCPLDYLQTPLEPSTNDHLIFTLHSREEPLLFLLLIRGQSLFRGGGPLWATNTVNL